MCVAVVVESKDRIPKKYLEAMHEANPHGAGVAWCEGNQILYKKGLSWKDINLLQERLPRPFFMHYRIATHGGRIPALTHPFPLGFQAFNPALEGKAPAVMMHNGTWGKFREWVPDGVNPNDVSDTQVAAFVAKYHENILAEVMWSTAVMKATDVAGRVDITLRGRWVEFEGNQYSNEYWKRELAPKVQYSHQSYSNYNNNYSFNFEEYLKKYPESRKYFPKYSHQTPKEEPKSEKKESVKVREDGSWELVDTQPGWKKDQEKTYTGDDAWKTGKEIFTQEALKAASSVPCPECGEEITRIPCECEDRDVPPHPQCPDIKCMSIDVEEIDDGYWFCQTCYACFDNSGFTDRDSTPVIKDNLVELETLSEEELDALDLADIPAACGFDEVIDGNRPGDQARINEIIREQGIKIEPVEE